MLGVRKGHEYHPDVRAYAITLSYFTPNGYEYIRDKFKKNLPHPATIRKWYSYSSSNGEPGMCKGSLDVLAKLAIDLKQKGERLRVTLSLDEMAIAKNVSWSECKKKCMGFINYGTIDENQRLPVASNAIVFMVNGINVRFNLPIGFYFINTLKTSEKMILIVTALKFLSDIDVCVSVKTFDGLSTNVTSMESLGARFDLDNMKPYIISPVDKSKIFILFDPPHMLKLMRNLIGSEKLLLDRSGKRIEWKFYEKLEKKRVDNGLVTHKITKKHLNWTDNKMNVG